MANRCAFGGEGFAPTSARKSGIASASALHSPSGPSVLTRAFKVVESPSAICFPALPRKAFGERPPPGERGSSPFSV